MRFHVAGLLKQLVGEHRAVTFDEPSPALDELRLVDSVSGDAKLMRVNQGIVAHIHAHTVMLFACSRCLEEFQTPVDVDCEEMFVPTIDVVTGQPYVATDVDPIDVFPIDGHHVLDISEAVRQHLVMATPMVPLHDPACRGLCPVCGVNLNAEPNHGHDRTRIDERLQPLSLLLEREKSPSES
jgi:uncharacterized protein